VIEHGEERKRKKGEEKKRQGDREAGSKKLVPRAEENESSIEEGRGDRKMDSRRREERDRDSRE